MHTIVLIHGVNNQPHHESWQDRGIRLFSGLPEIRIAVYKYGYVLPIGSTGYGAGVCWAHNWKVQVSLDKIAWDFAAFLEAQSQYSDKLSIAAHSYGTTITALMLQHLQRTGSLLQFHQILLAASACDPDFPWGAYSNRVGMVRHEFCPNDEVISLILGARLVPGAVPGFLGTSGIEGFRYLLPQNSTEESFRFDDVPDCHSLFVTEEHIVDHWFPFFLGHQFLNLCSEAKYNAFYRSEFRKIYAPFIVGAVGTLAKFPGRWPLTAKAEHDKVIERIILWGDNCLRDDRMRGVGSASKLIESAIEGSYSSP